MRLKDVKIGEEYHHYMGTVVAEEILERNPAERIYEPLIVCRFVGSKETRKAQARYLTPLKEWEAEQTMKQAEKEEIVANLQRIVDAIGEGAEVEPEVHQRYAMIKLTESAAERVLAKCEAKPLPDNRRPSKANSKPEKVKMSRLLGQRVRRALGVGYSGGWLGSYLYRETDNPEHQAMIYIYPSQVDQALTKLGGEKQSNRSALSEIF